MNVRKFRWSKVYESSEEELVQLLLAKKITAKRWAAEAYDSLAPRTHAQAMNLWCAEGSLTFSYDDKKISLQPGDVIQIPAHLACEMSAGISGCVCYEAPMTGSL